MKHDATLLKEAEEESQATGKPIKYTKAFYQLQMKWYKKLDSKGFDDIERTGRNRHKYLNEYHGNLKQAGRSVMRNYNFFASTALSNAQFFSWHGTELSKIDRKVLFLYGSGSTIREISSHLRRYYDAPSNRLGPSGKPYSIYWVHTRLKELLKLMSTWLGTKESLEAGYTDPAAPAQEVLDSMGGLEKEDCGE